MALTKAHSKYPILHYLEERLISRRVGSLRRARACEDEVLCQVYQVYRLSCSRNAIANVFKQSVACTK